MATRKYILTFCLAAISCMATKMMESKLHMEDEASVTISYNGQTSSAENVIHIMHELMLI